MHPFPASHDFEDYRTPEGMAGPEASMGFPTSMVLRRSEHQQLYVQFQARYPMGALVSELLQIQDGKFIVRASVQVGGITLATGLAAAYSPEISEDQARLRALEVIGVVPVSAMTMQEVKAELISPPRLFATAPQTQLQSASASAYYPAVAPTQFSSELSSESYQRPERLEQPSLNLAVARGDMTVRQEPPHPQTPTQPRSQTALPRRTPQSEPERGPNKSTKVSSPAPLVDLADVIAQTSVELKRLGWTEPQGRQHLQKHYSKRSRQQLTDAELLDFLQFLESQSSPSEALF